MVMVTYNLMSLFRFATLRARVIQSGQGCLAHAENSALQAIRQGWLHHHGGPNTRTQACWRHGQWTLDGRLFASLENLQSFSRFLSTFQPLKRVLMENHGSFPTRI